jgi:hypothetical protein
VNLTPAQVAEALRRANDVHRFPTLCRITRMDSSVGNIDPTPTQRILLDYFVEEPWTYTVKFRQAASSTVHVADQLRFIAYTPGAMGLCVGDKEDTSKELLRRAGIMYNGLPEPVRPPLARPVSSEAITFAHDGVIQGITGGGEHPAVGFSADYSCVSEYGLFENYDAFNGSFFPTVDRRPNAKCRMETTPGRYMTPAHEMYLSALAGKGRFCAIFLAWWHDDTCVKPVPPDFQPNPEEVDYRRRVALFEKDAIGKRWYRYKEPRGVSDGHILYRRIALETEFHGDTRLFDAKFPPNPFEGWLVGTSPTIPQDAIERLLRKAKPAPEGVETFYEEKEFGCPYVLLADGAGFGKSGDPSALTLVNMWDWREAGCWSGREDPNVFAQRIMRWQKKYDAKVIVEANKDGVCASLITAGCPEMHWSAGQPGWFSSGVSKAAALADLVNMLRAGEVDILSFETLQQLATWDGKGRQQETKSRKHHWDRAITWLIAAYAMRTLGIQRRPRPERIVAREGTTVEEFDGFFAVPNNGRVLGRLR